MTEEEIRKLAEQYAQRIGNFTTKPFKPTDEYLIGLAIEAELVIKWLSEKFCIVEKAVIKKEYDFWYQRLPKMCRLADKVNNDPDTARMWGKVEVLNDIFGSELLTIRRNESKNRQEDIQAYMAMATMYRSSAVNQLSRWRLVL